MTTLDKDENGGYLTARDVWNIADHQPIPLAVFGEKDIDGKTVCAKEVGDAFLLYKVACSDYVNKPVFTFTKMGLCEECGKKDCTRENFWYLGMTLGIVR